MGLFDHLICKYPLPDKEIQHEEFQTKDFECCLDTYIINKDGTLMVQINKNKYRNIDFHGDIIFYTSTGKHEDNSFKWYEYKGRFTDGKLKWIKEAKAL